MIIANALVLSSSDLISCHVLVALMGAAHHLHIHMYVHISMYICMHTYTKLYMFIHICDLISCHVLVALMGAAHHLLNIDIKIK
jgi:hypothetical protein